MDRVMIHLNHELVRKLLMLRSIYGHENLGQTIRLALMLYLWYLEKRKESRIVGALPKEGVVFLVFETDYPALALYVSSEIALEIEPDKDAMRDINYVVAMAKSESPSTVISEALYFLEHVTEAIREGRALIALDPIHKTYLEFIHPDFETLRTMSP